MRKYISFAETEEILRVALGLPGSSIKSIAEATGILFEEYMRKYVEQFKEKLPVEFETLLNGEKIHHSEITGAIADILQQAIDKMGQEIRIKIGI